MKIVVGSINPVKIAAVKTALSDRFSQLSVKGIAIASEVSDQPMTDAETKTGARRRAQKAMKQVHQPVDLAVGLEGGVFKHNGQLWSTVWCCVIDKHGRIAWANGGRFVLPPKLTQEVLAGKEIGPVMDHLTGRTNTKHQEGMLGILTAGLVTRRDAYAHLVKLAIGQLLATDWY